MKTMNLLALILTVAALLAGCVAADNNVRRDYDPPEHHGRAWN